MIIEDPGQPIGFREDGLDSLAAFRIPCHKTNDGIAPFQDIHRDSAKP